MKRWMLVIMGLLVFAGCVPEEKVVWSPDGKQAAVLGPEGLYLCDGEGKLSPPVAESVGKVAWTPDSKRLVVARQTPAATWDEAATLLDEGQVKDLIANAKKAKEELLAQQGPLEKFESKSFEQVSPTWGALMGLYLRDKLPDGLPEKMGEKWADVKNLTVAVFQIEVGEVSDGGVKFLPPILRTFDPPQSLRISPDGKSVAYVAGQAMVKSEGAALFVLPLAGGRLRQVADQVSLYPDWSGDGRFLVFGRAATPKVEGFDLRLGMVTRREVCAAMGVILEVFGDPEDLAGLIFNDMIKVRCLRDDRILFAAAPGQFPCTAADLGKKPDLFVIGPRPPGAVGRVAAADVALDEGVAWFEVSPDQKRVAIWSAGGVAIVTLADGRLETRLAEAQKDLLHVPGWRSAEELCLAVAEESKLGSPKRPEVILWSPKGSKIISKSWPDAIVEKMLKSAK